MKEVRIDCMNTVLQRHPLWGRCRVYTGVTSRGAAAPLPCSPVVPASRSAVTAVVSQGLPGFASQAALDFASSYFDYKVSVGEIPDPDELEETLVQFLMLGCSFAELRGIVGEFRECLGQPEEDWQRIFRERFLGFSRRVMDKFPVMLGVLKFEINCIS